MADFDAIVVGSGLAGAVAAHELARAGKGVLVVERGNQAGSKNVSGGRLYTHSLAAVFPGYASEAPLERRITHERIGFLAPDAGFTVDFTSDGLRAEGRDSYSVLRAPFDQWLASQAEDAGAEYICGIPVEDLLMEGSRVTGIVAGEDEITADAVLLCDGVNSLLTRKAVGYAGPTPEATAVGIKEVIKLDPQVIEDRLLVPEGEGAAWLFAGDATHGVPGGGFVYTNKESLSIGLVVPIADLLTGETPIYQLLDDFKRHQVVAPLIKGGEVIEHSGHMVPEGGWDAMPKLVGDGVLVAGDAAMMCLNLAYTVRGMDYAIAAGMHAGRAAAEALTAGDTSAAGLQGYVKALENSFVLQDLRQFRKVPHFISGTKRIFDTYPAVIRDFFEKLFIVDSNPTAPVRKAGFAAAKQAGLLNLARDMKGALSSL
ncbi:MAG: FAD-dependent oxidoreductase [Propionibacteriaceae bacterium]|jgi:electron transfer flavoprotein-quinone oxidoreductase|nr:FAD-dependent oxidoreductase [Propionibacteriaceae bacterium]